MSGWGAIEAVDALIRAVNAGPPAKAEATIILAEAERSVFSGDSVCGSVVAAAQRLLRDVDGDVQFTSPWSVARGVKAVAKCMEDRFGATAETSKIILIAEASMAWSNGGVDDVARSTAQTAANMLAAELNENANVDVL